MAASETTVSISPSAASRVAQIFPTLSPKLRAQVAAHGKLRPTRPGEVLYDVGHASAPFFLVTEGEIELVQPSADATILLRSLRPGQFTGEINLLSGRPALVQARVSAAGKVV